MKILGIATGKDVLPIDPEPDIPPYDPDKPDPENPDPENPDPENPDPENPDPENPGPENPDPENPDPENPDPENPDPENPDPENPDPENPGPENPDPENPDPENPDPENPDPENPDPEDPDPEDPGPNDPPADDENTSRGDRTEPSATDNVINTEATLQALAYRDEMLELKVTNGSAGLGLLTVDTLGNYHTTLTIQNGSMRVEIPGGFGKVNEPGRIYYPMDFMDNLPNAADLAAAVKEDNAKTQVVKAGGDMVMPTTVTVTLKTKLEGTVNIYYYNDETRRFTKLATTTAKDGRVTFATKQMGVMVLTTGTI